MSESAILQMPLHLLVIILSRLNDMTTLGSAILSNSLFYAAYKDNPRIIVQSIIRQQIPPDLLRYAANAYQASRVDRQDKWAMVRLCGWDMRQGPLHEWLARWEKDPTSASAAVAASLSRTHRVVRYYCQRFFRDTAPFVSELYGAQSSRAKYKEPSLAEKHRVYRALYRFQIYCNFGFRNEQDLQPSPEWAKDFQHSREARVFGAFSPWINEQLACIHDYLERRLSSCTFTNTSICEILRLTSD